MKTAISIPDAVFRSAERAARRLGMSRSQFYATAVADFIGRHEAGDVTAKLNEVYSDERASTLDPRDLALQARTGA